MKKKYIFPITKFVSEIETEPLAASGVTGETSDGETIGYGGTDDDGTKDPEAKPHYNVWED